MGFFEKIFSKDETKRIEDLTNSIESLRRSLNSSSAVEASTGPEDRKRLLERYEELLGLNGGQESMNSEMWQEYDELKNPQKVYSIYTPKEKNAMDEEARVALSAMKKNN